MRSASAGLIALLNSGTEFYVADLLTIIQLNGTITRLTSAPTNILSTSKAISLSDATIYTFLAGGPSFQRSRIKLLIGLEVSDMQLTIMASYTRDALGGVPWPQAARQGALDGATVVLERAFMAAWGVTTGIGTYINFSGKVGDVTPSRDAIALQVKSDLAVLAGVMPRNTYQPGCLHNLYDAGCTLSAGTFTVSGTVGVGSTASLIITNLTQANNYFELGQITFTSGLNNGLGRFVKTFVHASGQVVVVPPLPNIPANGDTFTIYPGCDKKQGTCDTKFSNLAHFRGFPYIPAPESAA